MPLWPPVWSLTPMQNRVEYRDPVWPLTSMKNRVEHRDMYKETETPQLCIVNKIRRRTKCLISFQAFFAFKVCGRVEGASVSPEHNLKSK